MDVPRALVNEWPSVCLTSVKTKKKQRMRSAFYVESSPKIGIFSSAGQPF